MVLTLLQKAKAHKVPYHSARTPKPGRQREELAVAWLRGEITFSQASAATGVKGSSLYGLLAVALRHAVVSGRLKTQTFRRGLRRRQSLRQQK
jgi:hypothetical protein